MKVDIGPCTSLKERKAGKKRKVKVYVHDYDTWSLDNTLTMIILPALKKFRKHSVGAPNINNEDIPEDLQRKNEEDWHEPDDNHFDRWYWVLDEMIWTFDEMLTNKEYNAGFTKVGDFKFSEQQEDGLFKVLDTGMDLDADRLKAREKRIENGLRLFGKYYRYLWN